MQMGEIPMLTREQEVRAAQNIDHWRAAFRISMLASDFVLQGAVELLEKVRDGNLRLDRTIEVSVTNIAEKKRIIKRLKPNLETLKRLLAENHRDFRIAISRKQPKKARKLAWRSLIRRRHRAIRLIEELNLRTPRLVPLLDQLAQIAQRMETLQEQIQLGGGEHAGGRTVAELQSELRYLIRISLDSPATLRRRLQRTEKFRFARAGAQFIDRKAGKGKEIAQKIFIEFLS